MNSEDVRDKKREGAYLKHALDADGRHLPEQCPECARVEGLERESAALAQTRTNCNVLLKSLAELLERHGCPYCLPCASARFLSDYVEHFRKTGEQLEPGLRHAPPSSFPDPRFEKIVAPNGYPVARFYTKMMSTEGEDPNHFHLDRETLSGIVERAQAEGRPAGEHGRALKALDDATREWSRTPWDGK